MAGDDVILQFAERNRQRLRSAACRTSHAGLRAQQAIRAENRHKDTGNMPGRLFLHARQGPIVEVTVGLEGFIKVTQVVLTGKNVPFMPKLIQAGWDKWQEDQEQR